jgi:hypothetical protein
LALLTRYRRGPPCCKSNASVSGPIGS